MPLRKEHFSECVDLHELYSKENKRGTGRCKNRKHSSDQAKKRSREMVGVVCGLIIHKL